MVTMSYHFIKGKHHLLHPTYVYLYIFFHLGAELRKMGNILIDSKTATKLAGIAVFPHACLIVGISSTQEIFLIELLVGATQKDCCSWHFIHIHSITSLHPRRLISRFLPPNQSYKTFLFGVKELRYYHLFRQLHYIHYPHYCATHLRKLKI